MRWRFTDKVTRFEPWSAIEGRKAVSFEEYNLLAPFGRKGCLPESIVIESCVHLARWLVMASSGFSETCVISEMDRFEFARGTMAGSVLNLSLRVVERSEGRIRLACEVADRTESLGRGNMVASLEPLAEMDVVEDMRAMWRELHAKT
jgi:hypothetical protein